VILTPSTIDRSLTIITVTGILRNGIHLVFLPAGDQTCTNAAFARGAQSGGSITNGAISIQLATAGLYKTCFSTLANPLLDAQFTYLTATQLFVVNGFAPPSPSPSPPAMSVVGFTLRLAGDVSSFTPSVQSQIKSATAARAGVDLSAVELTISPGSVIVGVRILTPTATAASVQSTMASATSTPSSATAMFASVTGVSIAVLAVVTPPTIANVAPPPPLLLTGALAVETSGSIGINIGIILGLIIALVLAMVFMRRRRHLNEKRRKNVGLQGPNGQPAGLQVPNGREAQSDEKGASAQKAKAESADEMVAPVVPKPTGATKAPVALKLQLDQLALEGGFPTGATKAPEAPKLLPVLADQEGFELQNTPLVSTFLGMFTPKPVVVQNV
jgi:hypothetical protein